MRAIASPALPVISPQIYAQILAKQGLAAMLFPEGIATSPYEILDYDAVLVLDDPHGMRATFQRTQKIRFLHDGVAALLDHCWGEGIIVTSYQHGAGVIADAFSHAGRRHLAIELNRPYRRGEVIEFTVTREVMGGFTSQEEWLETTVDHPTVRLRRRIVFPKKRPCQEAILLSDASPRPMSIREHAGGRTALQVEALNPEPGAPLTIVWRW